MSIMGLYNNDDSIFDLMSFPEGFTDDDKQLVQDSILVECAELEILYPAPAVMKTCIGIWSRKELPYWQRVYDASKLEYNPIENYNRTELEMISDDRTDTHSGSDISTLSGSDSNQSSYADTENNTGTDTQTNKISAYDSNTLVNHDQNDLTHGHSISQFGSGSNSTTYGKTDTFTHGETIVHDGDISRTNKTTGNIGVTTSQQMLEQEVEIAAKLNVIKMIVDAFKERFCILVY